MKPTTWRVVAALVAVCFAGRCVAMMDIEDVNVQRAKELGLEVRAQPAGPQAVWVELSFEPKGALATFERVSLEMHDGGKLLLSSALKEEKTRPGRVVVSFTADRASVDKLTLRVVTGEPMNYAGHDMRVKDFVDVAKLK